MNINFFEKPLSAGPGDTVVGQSEFGPVYKTVTGETYTIAPKEDQRTGNEKIREAFTAAKEWAQDPSFPEWEEVADMVQEMGAGAWEGLSIPGDLASGERSPVDVQMGEAMGMAPAMGAASAPFKVPEGATRIFGGTKAKKADKITDLSKFDPNKPSSYARARKMKEGGVDDGTIWEETGWQWDKENGAWQFEIDSSQLKFKEDANFEVDVNEEVPLNEVIEFPELFENYPQLENTRLKLVEGRGGYFNIDTDLSSFPMKEVPIIAIGKDELDNPERVLDIITHELQHGVQAIEGTSGGSNNKYLSENPPTPEMAEKKVYLDNLIEQSNELEEKWRKIAVLEENDRTPGQQADYENLAAELEEITNEIIDRFEDYNRDAFLYYKANPGEIEARAAAGRRYLTKGEKAESPPSETKREMLNRELDRYRGAIMPTARLSSYSDQARYSKGGLVQRRTK